MMPIAWQLVLSALCLFPAQETGAVTGEIREEAFKLYENGEIKKALRLFEKSLAQTPNDPDVLQTVGFIHYRAENFNQAESFFGRVLAIQGESPYSLCMLGNIAFRQFKLGEAKELYAQVARLDAEYPTLQENSARLDERIARVLRLEELRARCDRFYWISITAAAGLFLAIAVIEAAAGRPKN